MTPTDRQKALEAAERVLQAREALNKASSPSEVLALTDELKAACREEAEEVAAALLADKDREAAYPSVDAMRAAVELEITACVGKVTTLRVGQLIQRVLEADRAAREAMLSAMLGALKAMVNDWEPENDGGTYRRHWEEANAAIALAEAAGIRGEAEETAS